jgi:hypothetical protein
MNKKIVYTDPQTGTMSVVCPSPFCDIPIEQIALKDVPPNVPYLIVDDADLPSDFTFQHAWEADFSQAHGVGADYGTGSENEVVAWNSDWSPVVKANV